MTYKIFYEIQVRNEASKYVCYIRMFSIVFTFIMTIYHKDKVEDRKDVLPVTISGRIYK